MAGEITAIGKGRRDEGWKERGRRVERKKGRDICCTFFLSIFLFLSKAFFYLRSISFSISLSLYGTVGRHGASRPKALEAIPRHARARKRKREKESFDIPLAGHFILAPPCGREPFYLSRSFLFSIVLCSLVSHTGPCVPSFSLSHALPRLSLDFARLGSLFPLSLSPVDGRRCRCVCSSHATRWWPCCGPRRGCKRYVVGTVPRSRLGPN